VVVGIGEHGQPGSSSSREGRDDFVGEPFEILRREGSADGDEHGVGAGLTVVGDAVDDLVSGPDRMLGRMASRRSP
jgi:hypothetical protein